MSLTTERFELQTRLAAGNAGLVYRGIEKATRRPVALKLLIETGLPFPLDGQALLRDLARVRRTAGNNIAQLLDVIDDDDVGVVLVYEYADGLNWTDAAKQRQLDGAQAVDIAAQLLSALAVSEAIRVPHGELKPMNLVLGELPGGRLFVWVLDWGLACYRPVPPPDALPWLTPERLAGAPASTEADLFAMGACLCWLLTATVPVAGETREELAAAWRRFPANALAQMRPDLPAKFTRWVGALLNVNPKKRFGTVAEARQALAALDPPAPPVLPEIFRPRPKSPFSSAVGPARSGIVPMPRAVAIPRVIAVPASLESGEGFVIGIPEENPALTEREPVEDEAAGAAEKTGEQYQEPALEWESPPESEATTETRAEDEPAQETEPEPTQAAEPEPVVVPTGGRKRLGLGLAVLALLTVVVGVWSFRHRPGVAAQASEGTAAHGPTEVVLHRDLAPRAAFCPDGKGGLWWCSFKLTHFSPPGRPGSYELQGNLFNESAIDDVIRLTFTESAGRITVASFPAHSSAALPGPANESQRILVSIKATPVDAGTFNVELDLWANPNLAPPSPPQKGRRRRPASPIPAPLGPPALRASASKAALPPRLGVLFQKKADAGATTTLISDLRLGRTPQEALQ